MDHGLPAGREKTYAYTEPSLGHLGLLAIVELLDTAQFLQFQAQSIRQEDFHVCGHTKLDPRAGRLLKSWSAKSAIGL